MMRYVNHDRGRRNIHISSSAPDSADQAYHKILEAVKGGSGRNPQHAWECRVDSDGESLTFIPSRSHFSPVSPTVATPRPACGRSCPAPRGSHRIPIEKRRPRRNSTSRPVARPALHPLPPPSPLRLSAARFRVRIRRPRTPTPATQRAPDRGTRRSPRLWNGKLFFHLFFIAFYVF